MPFYTISRHSVRFVNCYINYGPDQEALAYNLPYLDEQFPGETVEFLWALYYVVFAAYLSALLRD
ncbi:hypothetical protein PRIPAC_81670 [Pristionchus pacificus]|uniref:Uncharacterized protein n=1 Tax=Pristionchus pacificus TaxID=54126 RepID=A0A2A6CKH7_PRIPA|nr:hypothetical protein PRIPAC_81670 [Pristionchus pacificus]|eukprot:PDM78724.1 hypothetical protein PRIPAC_31303 [Pristionchus pacificus]